jgi:hypothetical protein
MPRRDRTLQFMSSGSDVDDVHGPVVLIARFRGDVQQLTSAYNRAHKMIIQRGGRSVSCGTTARPARTGSTSSVSGGPRSSCALALA